MNELKIINELKKEISKMENQIDIMLQFINDDDYEEMKELIKNEELKK